MSVAASGPRRRHDAVFGDAADGRAGDHGGIVRTRDAQRHGVRGRTVVERDGDRVARDLSRRPALLRGHRAYTGQGAAVGQNQRAVIGAADGPALKASPGLSTSVAVSGTFCTMVKRCWIWAAAMAGFWNCLRITRLIIWVLIFRKI